MARDYFINGETLVKAKGNVAGPIPALTEVGLAAGEIRISPTFRHSDIQVDAWGDGVPEVQFMLADINISMTLVHFDRTVLDYLMQESMAGSSAYGTVGTLTRAGSRMGNGVARFAAGWHFVSLNLLSPVGAKPWRIYNAYLTGSPIMLPLGTEKSQVSLQFRGIPYTPDPWNGGLGAQGQILWDHILDT